MHMKSKILFYTFAVTLFMFAACSEDEITREPSPTVSAGNLAVRFASDNNIEFELDPANELSFTLTVIRDNATAAAEVPITVITNTENSFIFPSTVSFPAGEDTVVITITMSASAPTGQVLPFEIAFEGDDYVNPYKMEYSMLYGEVSIVKWNNLGTVQFYDSFAFYSVAEVTLEQRDDMPNVYRISYPYQEDILIEAEWGDWIGGATQSLISFTVDGDNVTWDDFWYTNTLYQGASGAEIKAYLPSVIGQEGDDQSVVVKDNDGNIQYFELYPSFYIDGLGGFGLYAVYVGMPGYDLAGDLGLPVFGQ